MASMDVKRATYTVPMPRELLLNAGLVEPTDIEQAKAERASAEYQVRAERQAAILATARTQLAALTDPLARAILDLHSENEDGECRGDDFTGWEAEPPQWPCDTVSAVAIHYGIHLGSRLG